MAASLWSRALRQALVQEPEAELFSAVPVQGCLRLRQAIAGHLRAQRGVDVGPERIIVGAGAQLLHGSIALMLARREEEGGPAIAMEDPGWPALRATYACRGVRVASVPMDAEGIGMGGLRASGARTVHVMPSHQFPTGRVTSVARRYELLGWAEASGTLIVEDDYDWEFRLAGRPIPSLASIDASGRVIYVSTFSKSLSGALRIAFMVLPDGLMGAWRAEPGLASATVSTIDQVALARLLESGDYERHVARYRTQSREVRDALLDALRATPLGPRMGVEEADSGLHFVLAIDTDVPEAEVAARAERLGVRLAPLSGYAADPASLPADGRARFVMQYDGLDAARAGEVAAAIAQSC
ncbi:MAG: PLP-dependent aminotransferase family protein [Atopobiaceae bacterium]|nr:PLP-dependent aminotransferase family protein [Atopobiaceae bacterium]MCH4120538.1 PLP-dependent aminotransferase family protein [Atopobiaceae bacterium]MCI1318979.1 PLP-dependent aminotransferase family protein [Atopobiaceae bacterium]MCI1389503.1 PLP-dependent aminotransferase family protein [Atopobiaceae bacterium]MCI1432216.1 PLP-dependent aminotransferase family protein [Atopobiaceae bacterium]